jgi:hypothetical protein
VVTVFIDSAGVMDDTTATAHVTAEADALRHAPANVTHTLHLVHRTGGGDRDIHGRTRPRRRTGHTVTVSVGSSPKESQQGRPHQVVHHGQTLWPGPWPSSPTASVSCTAKSFLLGPDGRGGTRPRRDTLLGSSGLPFPRTATSGTTPYPGHTPTRPGDPEAFTVGGGRLRQRTSRGQAARLGRSRSRRSWSARAMLS